MKNTGNKIKIICIAFILSGVLLANLAGISSCGLINQDSGDGEDLTFASKNNYDRDDIMLDAFENPTAIKSNGDLTDAPATENQTVTEVVDTVEPVTDETENIETTGDIADTLEDTSEITEITNATDAVETTEAIPTVTQPPAPPPQNIQKQPDKEGTTRLSFLAAGDNIMHLNMINDAQERAKNGEAFNFIDMYTHIAATVKAADIALVNVETPIAGDEFKYDGYPNFNTPKENAFALIDIGFDIVATANNHMLDKWEKGYMNSIEFWEKQKNILQIGSFRNKEDFENIRIYEKDGVSIAFLSYTYGTNGMTLPAGSQMVIPYIDENTIDRQVKAAKPLADLVFVVMHWGDEDNFTSSQWQRSLAQRMVDNGVDVIIGMHPHVLQETKWVDRPDGKKTLVTYSIGNMISGMLGAKNMLGAFLAFDIVKTTENGISNTTIENAEMIPVVTHFTNTSRGIRNFEIYRFDEYTEELANNHGNRTASGWDKKFSYKFIKDLILQNIATEFLSDFYKD